MSRCKKSAVSGESVDHVGDLRCFTKEGDDVLLRAWQRLRICLVFGGEVPAGDEAGEKFELLLCVEGIAEGEGVVGCLGSGHAGAEEALAVDLDALLSEGVGIEADEVDEELGRLSVRACEGNLDAFVGGGSGVKSFHGGMGASCFIVKLGSREAAARSWRLWG